MLIDSGRFGHDFGALSHEFAQALRGLMRFAGVTETRPSDGLSWLRIGVQASTACILIFDPFGSLEIGDAP